MLAESELHDIAHRAVARVSTYLRDDAYQEAWLRFLRYPPPNRLYAGRAANSARDDLCRQERQFQQVKKLAPGLFDLPQPSAVEQLRYWRRFQSKRRRERLLIQGVREAHNAQRRAYYRKNLERARAATRKRVRLHRQKAQRIMSGGC